MWSNFPSPVRGLENYALRIAQRALRSEKKAFAELILDDVKTRSKLPPELS